MKKSEPNAQNSEIKPESHPSGARIEKIMKEAERSARPTGPVADSDGFHGEHGANGKEEILRPSERYSPPLEPAEGERSPDDVHRRNPATRTES